MKYLIGYSTNKDFKLRLFVKCPNYTCVESIKENFKDLIILETNFLWFYLVKWGIVDR